MLVEARTLGRRGAVVEPTRVAISPGSVLLRDLVATVVRHEVAAYASRERARRLVRVLTADDLADGAARGAIDPAAHRAEDPVDVGQAVLAALQAFEDGIYFTFVDDVRIDDLDDRVDLADDTVVRFVRLVALAGG
ncbi:hypothetical protein [Salsipaludibacter albus]|uniref:hypothetical protein n=1 Tax=Salsipaludibacter albus TaxID=2849650 RepID=UPI001EE3D531|nr:hypothetical protein [Salsipaludibacter albus]MBY5162168.1 hypothetical protein [Salsipaludibacter albus]